MLMKRLLLLFLIVMATMSANAQRGRRTVYYLVNGSYSTLAEAKKACNDNSQCEVVFLRRGPIYQARANGKTVYRMCSACFYSKQKAQELANLQGGWIWPSNGLAKCVYLGYYEDENERLTIKMKPLTPK